MRDTLSGLWQATCVLPNRQLKEFFTKLGFSLHAQNVQVYNYDASPSEPMGIDSSYAFFSGGGTLEITALSTGGRPFQPYVDFLDAFGSPAWLKIAPQSTNNNRIAMDLCERGHAFSPETFFTAWTPNVAQDNVRRLNLLLCFMLENAGVAATEILDGHPAETPALLEHANGATQLSDVLICADNVDDARRLFADYLSLEFAGDRSLGRATLANGSKLTLVDASGLADTMPGARRTPGSPVVAPFVKVADLDKVAHMADKAEIRHIRHGDRILVQGADDRSPKIGFEA